MDRSRAMYYSSFRSLGYLTGTVRTKATALFHQAILRDPFIGQHGRKLFASEDGGWVAANLRFEESPNYKGSGQCRIILARVDVKGAKIGEVNETESNKAEAECLQLLLDNGLIVDDDIGNVSGIIAKRRAAVVAQQPIPANSISPKFTEVRSEPPFWMVFSGAESSHKFLDYFKADPDQRIGRVIMKDGDKFIAVTALPGGTGEAWMGRPIYVKKDGNKYTPILSGGEPVEVAPSVLDACKQRVLEIMVKERFCEKKWAIEQGLNPSLAMAAGKIATERKR